VSEPNPTFNPPIPPPPVKPPSRHTKIIVGVILGLAVLFAGFVFGILWLVTSLLKGSDVGKEAFARAQANPAIVQQLGTPIKEGWMASGSINISGSSGNAEMALPISGPRGKATLFVTAKKDEGVWTYSVMQVVIDGSSQKIDLLNAGAPNPGGAH
jgi:hypothetical protein